MVILNQRNPKWSGAHLGSSPQTVGRAGCTTTCLSMLSDFFGCFLRPDEIAAHTDWYTPTGLVIWEKLGFKHMKFQKRIRNQRVDSAIVASMKAPDYAVLLEVNNGSHWVVVLRKTLFGNSYVVADPLYGDKCDVLRRYGNITGSAHLMRV